MICNNLSVGANGHLFFAGQDTVELAKKYGTPVYIMDEDKIREKCRAYKKAFQKNFGDKAVPLYASKANCFKRLYEIMTEEGMGIDVVSSGEIYTAVAAGFDMSMAYFHSNNKTDWDIAYAMDNGVGYFVADNYEEVDAVEKEAAKRGIRQKILLRLTPGIDPHTYEANATGKIDSKFGTAIETGQALEIVEYTLKQSHIHLRGFHCHVGSQVFEEDVFERAAVIMLEFIGECRDKLGYIAEELDLGGGYGVRYVESDPYLDVETKVGQVADAVKSTCKRLGLDVPEIHMEPGRSIVADAGMVLYTVGTVKRITGYKNYVSIDGGMPDNPRYILYQSEYEAVVANKADQPRDEKVTIAGRCCESGDLIGENMPLQHAESGDIIAVLATGAYNFSMAMTYNRLQRPAVVFVKGGESRIGVRRESLDDIIRNDV